MSETRVLILLAAVAVVGVFGLFGTFLSMDPDQPLWFEVGKGAIQLVVVVFAGGLLKVLVDRYQSEQQQAQKNQQFRQDKYERLVQATNQLRKARIDPELSMDTGTRQILAVADVELDLRMIKHQVYSSWAFSDPPLPDAKNLAHLLVLMYRSVETIRERLEQHHQHRQPRGQADAPEQFNPERELQQSSDNPMLTTGILTDPSDDELDNCRDQIERREEPLDYSWTTYLAAEGLALERITEATLNHGRPRRFRAFLRRFTVARDDPTGGQTRRPFPVAPFRALAAHHGSTAAATPAPVPAPVQASRPVSNPPTQEGS